MEEPLTLPELLAVKYKLPPLLNLRGEVSHLLLGPISGHEFRNLVLADIAIVEDGGPVPAPRRNVEGAALVGPLSRRTSDSPLVLPRRSRLCRLRTKYLQGWSCTPRAGVAAAHARTLGPQCVHQI